MPKRYKPFLDYKSLDYVSDLNAIELHVYANCIFLRDQLVRCGTEWCHVLLGELTDDLTQKLTVSALYCNAHISRSPKRLMANISGFGINPQAFSDDPESFDPEAKTMLLGAIARLSPDHAAYILRYELGMGPGPLVAQITEAIPQVLAELQKEARELPPGKPEHGFQTQLAVDLGKIFLSHGGTLRRDPKKLGKTPFREFLECLIPVLQPFARQARFLLNVTTMIDKAQEALEPKH